MKVEEAIALKVKVLERRKAELLICVADLDSWDEKRIGEPDHDKRYNAYTTLNQVRRFFFVLFHVFLRSF